MKFISDQEFIRGNCPMTKEEIRMLSISKMDIENNSVVLDVGSGTGSITVQSALICKDGKVISVEKEDEPYKITKSNINKFNCQNVELRKAEATVCLDNLIEENIRFDSIFIGGSGGHLKSIIEKCDKILKKDGVIVMNFITLDNTYKAVEEIKNLNYNVDISHVNISKNRGKTLMMTALNPIYIIKCTKKQS